MKIIPVGILDNNDVDTCTTGINLGRGRRT